VGGGLIMRISKDDLYRPAVLITTERCLTLMKCQYFRTSFLYILRCQGYLFLQKQVWQLYEGGIQHLYLNLLNYFLNWEGGKYINKLWCSFKTTKAVHRVSKLSKLFSSDRQQTITSVTNVEADEISGQRPVRRKSCRGTLVVCI